jgi:hypothetical protein
MEAYAVVDGWARVRAILSQGDPADGMDWVLAGMKDFDGRGNVRRSYQPMAYDGGENLVRNLDLRSGDAPYEEAKYDAFGRRNLDHNGRRRSRSNHWNVGTDAFEGQLRWPCAGLHL